MQLHSFIPLFRKWQAIALLAAASVATVSAQPAPLVVQTQLLALKVETLLEGLDHPWALAFLPGGQALVTERSGALLWLQSQPSGAYAVLGKVAGVPAVVARGQGGLLDVALHPDFARTRWVYLSYVGADAEGRVGTELFRGRLELAAGKASLQDGQVLFKAQPKANSALHFGGRVVFDRAGLLYLTLGEQGDKARAQRMNDHAGSVVRLQDDGRVPAGNPFVGQSGVLPEPFTKGHRNVQGAALNPQTGRIWTHEHGPQGGDEINILQAGRNYGWPVITYGVNYGFGTKIGEGSSKAGLEQPLYKWVPSIAPSGMAFVSGPLLQKWSGDVLIGALVGQALVRLRLQGDAVVSEERLLQNKLGRIRDVRMGPDGAVYVLTDDSNGKLIRLSPA